MRWREALTRVRGAIGLGRADRDLEQELGFHLDMLERRHLERGLTREQAHRAARLELGGSAQIAENWRDQRGLPFLETLRADLGYGLRALRRSPAAEPREFRADESRRTASRAAEWQRPARPCENTRHRQNWRGKPG